ncbi:hypothetical protein NUW54_g6318 [Trametes sanguinea]|uniref:Uncharacterized protein n=1 Tax=Trametes sanguinea TaxID=158606 RepID=A0ACC1PU91_9APHY|nr:hypothetical protein NUW54_g6318 [Trametes sanguinea]
MCSPFLIYSPVLTVFSASRRMKAILFTLIRAFEFELAFPPERILIKTAPLQRPFLRDEEGAQLPLLIKPVRVA